MKYRALLCLVTLSVIGTLLAGCGGTPKPPVGSTKHLQELVQAGQTLNQVQDLMTDALKDRMTIYPAESIQKHESGNWQFQAKEGGSPGDTDAPYLAIVIKPDPDNNKYYAVFFKDRQVITAEWFTSQGAAVIHKVLGNLIDLEGAQETE